VVPLAPDTLHTPAPLEATVNTTGLPDPPPVADKAADPPTDPDAGAVNEIAWGAASTVIACWASGAGWYLALPTWLASMTQRPGWLKVTVEAEIEHTDSLEESMVKVTRLPEPPPDAATA
jgi:hypothetical protein